MYTVMIINVMRFRPLTLNEVGTNSRIIGDLTPPGYTFRHWPRPGAGGYGGCGVLFKDSYRLAVQPRHGALSFESLEAIPSPAKVRLFAYY